jgi:nucleoside phosphorylase
MLDKLHPDLPKVHSDSNKYTLGSIGLHNVVIACLPSGHYGTVNAAVVATNMTRSFPSISIKLMVGIGGGVPAQHDVRLGDVVVGHKVVQFDYGKTTSGGEFHMTSEPVRPPQALAIAASYLQSRHQSGPSKIPMLLSEMLNRNPTMKHYSYPYLSSDRLFDATYEHEQEVTHCDSCDQSRLVSRTARAGHDPVIHYGTVASGNQVVKHAKSRDKWAARVDAICFEMEAAGLVDHFQCLVIRGICDYCDSHKNKEWQPYAAATSAAFAKELLTVMDAEPSRSMACHPVTFRGSYCSKKS